MDVEILGSGPITVLALHGIQGTRASWRAIASRLAGSARFILPNLRGRGAGPRGRSAQNYTLQAYAADAAGVLQQHVLPGEPFFLAGWSMGVSVVLELLHQCPALRPAGLILVSGTPAISRVRWFTADGPALRAEIAQREMRLGLREAADHEAVAATWESLRTTDQRGLLRSIDVPTLVIHGREDADCPWRHGFELALGVLNARLVTLDDAGHDLLGQCSDQVAEEIACFICPEIQLLGDCP